MISPELVREAEPACDSAGERAYRCLTVVEEQGPSAVERAGKPKGWGANALREAYGLPRNPAPGQKVAVVVAYDYPGAAIDLNKYRRTYGLPQCTAKSGCFTKINQDGEKGNYPKPDKGWAVEAALDLQMISVACPKCKLVLAEGKAPYATPLGKATNAAIAKGAVVTNHSYGSAEYTGIRKENRYYAHEGVTAVAASGDSGFVAASFPASSPDVVSVGGTVLKRSDAKRGWSEAAWKYAGSGCSAYFEGPEGQDDADCDARTIADLSAVSSGLAVYNKFAARKGESGWFVVGGTSASSPLIAGMILRPVRAG